jgi:hypothetical protein
MKNIIATITALFIIKAVSAQPIDSTLSRYANDFLQEKAWLHYDKSSYYPGETIWFKAYLMEAFYPSAGSKTLYTDWIGEDGKVLMHLVSPLVSATTNGQFEIPADYSGSFIHVRAYTKWMLNFDSAFLYSKDIRILLKSSTAAKTQKPAPVSTLELFPEGGDLVSGVPNRVAFKAADQWGRPVRIRGQLQNNKGQVLDTLKVVHDGMGSFFCSPQAGESYLVKWTDAAGVSHTTPLPPSKPSGIAMQISNAKNRRIINLLTSALLPDNLKTVHLIGTLNQRIAFKTDLTLTENNNSRRVIPTENLPSGILTITLFDQGWNAVSERISFINNHDYSFEPSMEVQRWGLSKRKKNEVRITVPDSLQGVSLSVSVTDAAIEKDTTGTIISHFLLTSDIRGRVFNPSYYFTSDDDSIQQSLDLVMLTHGWRRFKWEDVTRGKLPVIIYPKEESYLTLSGKVFGVVKSQLSGKESIVLVLKGKDSTSKLMVLPIKTDGTFNDPDVVFFDTLRVYYSLKSKFFSQAEARFMTERLPAPNYSAFSKNFQPYLPLFDTSGSYRHSLFAAESARLNEQFRGKMMANVTVTAKQKTTIQQMEERYPSGMFKGSDGFQFDLLNDPSAVGAMNIFHFLQGRVAGLQVNESGTPSLSWRGGSPQLYLDESPVDPELMATVPVNDIAYVKVFRPPFMGGFNGANGAIAVYTRRGNDIQNKPGTGLTANTIAGYTPIRQFYSPDYDRFDPRNEQGDIRTTLYWNPLVVPDKKGSVLLTFFNNDITKSFRVVIEGMTKEGLLTHFEQIME